MVAPTRKVTSRVDKKIGLPIVKQKDISAKKIKAKISNPAPIVAPLPKTTKRKSGKSKKITISEHERTSYEHIYAGVCKNCLQAYERLSFGNNMTVYCGSCAALTLKGRKKYAKTKAKNNLNIVK